MRDKISLWPIMHALVDKEFDSVPGNDLGFVWSTGERLVVYATSKKFLEEALEQPNVTTVLLDENVSRQDNEDTRGKVVVKIRNAKLNFFRLHNSLRAEMVFGPTKIHPTARIDENALVSPFGVIVGADCQIEAFCIVEAGSVLGDRVIVRSGSKIGTNALDIKEDEFGDPVMTDHLGGVVIEDDVEIGYNSVIDRAIFRQTATRVGAMTKTSSFVNISHGVELGRRNRLAAGVKICGSTFIGDDNWFGPSSTISNLLKIGSRNWVALGAAVLSDLGDDSKVIGTRVFKDKQVVRTELIKF